MPIMQTMTKGPVSKCSTEGRCTAEDDWVSSVIHCCGYVTHNLGVPDHFSSILAGSVSSKESLSSHTTILSLFTLLSQHALSLYLFFISVFFSDV